MCNCVKVALDKGYIIRNSIYNEAKHDFVDTNDYYMAIVISDKNGKPKLSNLHIHCCPICGDKLEVN